MLCYWRLIDRASPVPIMLLFCQLRWSVTAWEAMDSFLAVILNVQLPPTPPPSVTLCVWACCAPRFRPVWRIELCHFVDCFPGIVFLSVSAVLLEHYKSIKRSFLRFSSISRHLLQDASVMMGSVTSRYKNENKGVSLSLPLSLPNTFLTITSYSMVAYIG